MLQGGEMRSCLIVSNLTIAAPIPLAGGMRTGGGGIFSLSANGKIINCTIADNISEFDGGGVYDIDFFGSGATTFYENTVLYFNNALSNGNNYIGASLRFLYSCTTPDVPAQQDGGGNIFSNPQFVNVTSGNYNLDTNSPCLNVGTNMLWMIGAKDLSGNPRIFAGIVDMGAYEFVPEPAGLLLIGNFFFLFLRKNKK